MSHFSLCLFQPRFCGPAKCPAGACAPLGLCVPALWGVPHSPWLPVLTPSPLLFSGTVLKLVCFRRGNVPKNLVFQELPRRLRVFGTGEDCCFRNGHKDHVDLVERMQKSLKVAQKTTSFWNGPKHLMFSGTVPRITWTWWSGCRRAWRWPRRPHVFGTV